MKKICLQCNEEIRKHDGHFIRSSGFVHIRCHKDYEISLSKEDKRRFYSVTSSLGINKDV